jgi:CTP:molybdopterin cytidylyltransferase MocA
MGAQKLLLPLGDRPVLAHVVAALQATAATPIAVVLGYEAERILAAISPRGWQPIQNIAYAEGMASSFRAGIGWLAARADAPSLGGALIVLGDQPLITTAHLRQLLHAAHTAPTLIHAATFAGRRGTPVYFPQWSFAELLALHGDEGGRSLLARHSERVRLVALEPAEAALDVDTPEDYARVSALWQAHSATGTS